MRIASAECLGGALGVRPGASAAATVWRRYGSIDQFDELARIDEFDGPVRQDRQGAGIVSHEGRCVRSHLMSRRPIREG